ncbi:octopamine receptor Oamb-like [Patiria miniata]|uniref:G-protein coupled receptors family 1 profile domain-containing protein n=1 Tax=Patiria miniata TaxID=46514 RepID=A0A914BK52_PATMI|nr:octopamine receptor Oamb-like [Patiria miniata]
MSGAVMVTTPRWEGLAMMSASPQASNEPFGTTENSTSLHSDDDGDGGGYMSYDVYDVFPRRPLEVETLISVILWLICSVTVIGNVLVISTFVRDRELRLKPANLFILNLSVSDLLIGLISIPFFNVWRHTEMWLAGEVACKLWNIVDYTATTQSALAIVLISFDRYMLVSKGLQYRKYITLRLTQGLIVTSWVFSFSLNSIPILCSDIVLEPWVEYNQDCDFAILYQFSYKLTTAMFSFVIPLIFLSIFNIIVYNNIRARSRGFNRGRSSGLNSSVAIARSNSSQSRGSSEYRKHRKAAITLALIVGMFLTCWLPWYVYKLAIIDNEAAENRDLMDGFIYLLWANSAINPFLYAATHPRIRAGLIARIMCCVPRNCRPVRVRGGSRSNSDDPNAQTDRARHRTITQGLTTCYNEDQCNNQGSAV